MTSTINASSTGSGGIVQTADASGILQLQTNGTAAVTIDASQNMGLGTTSPGSARLAIDTTAGIITGFNSTNANGGYITVATSGTVIADLGTATNCFGSGGNDTFAINGRGARSLLFGTNNAERMRIDSSGDVSIGSTGGGARLRLNGIGTTSATYATLTYNSSNVALLSVRNDGAIFTGTSTSGLAACPYNNTTAAAANMTVGTSGDLQRSTSSLKYKTDVQDATHGLVDALKLRAVTYKGKNDGETIFGGLIAEEVHEAGLTEFVQYAEDGSPDALAYGNMVSLCIKAIQEQQALITQLQTDVAALKAGA